LGSPRSPLEDLNQDRLEARIRDVARRLFSDKQVDDLETWHLVQVVEHCSRAISDIYRTVNLDQILRGSIRPPRTLGELLPTDTPPTAQPLGRVTRVPEELRGIGDRCLYDIGMAGVKNYRGLSLETLGIRSYKMAADILSILANERDLRELFQRNRMRSLPIEEEVAFLRQCAARFSLHAKLLTTLREETPTEAAPGVRVATNVAPPMEIVVEGESFGGQVDSVQAPLSTADGARLSHPGEPRDKVLSRYERILLFADTDIEAVRKELKRLVVDQEEAVDALCDDLLLSGTGTQLRGVPQSYFLVGPTGVGKNHLMESLASVLESHWGVEIPFLTIEGPQYTYPSDVHELRGATRGFIRSDEPGILSEFHERSSRAPLSIILVDEVEKAHPQLTKFFLSIMDRGSIHDNRGAELSFEGSLLAFTSNLGYSTSDSPVDPIGYRGGSREGIRRQRGEAERHFRRALSPEFLARLRTIRFTPLSMDSMEAILEMEVQKTFRRFLELHGLEVSLTVSARRQLLDIGFSPVHGARHLVGVVRRYCNVEVSRRIKQDRVRGNEDRGLAVRYLREIRKGERAFEAEEVERAVLRHARAALPYSRLLVDFANGEFCYRVQGQ
jgi:Cdc48 subfamily AAA family protein/ClpA/ClpB-like protein